VGQEEREKMKPFANCEKIADYIDTSKPVEVYRNLHKNCFSVRQSGIVCCHTTEIVLGTLTACTEDVRVALTVGKKGRERVIKEGRKNVHAFARGYFCPDLNRGGIELIELVWPYDSWIKYNPYKFETFVDMWERPVTECEILRCKFMGNIPTLNAYGETL
jgi:hypothetical protein